MDSAPPGWSSSCNDIPSDLELSPRPPQAVRLSQMLFIHFVFLGADLLLCVQLCFRSAHFF